MPAQVIQEKNLDEQIEKAEKLLKELEERAKLNISLLFVFTYTIKPSVIRRRHSEGLKNAARYTIVSCHGCGYTLSINFVFPANQSITLYFQNLD